MAKQTDFKTDLLEALTRGSVTINIDTKQQEQLEKATMQIIQESLNNNQALIANVLLNGKGIPTSDQAVIAKALEKAIKQLLDQSAQLKNQSQKQIKQEAGVTHPAMNNPKKR